jgi:hypothetical protein
MGVSLRAASQLLHSLFLRLVVAGLAEPGVWGGACCPQRAGMVATAKAIRSSVLRASRSTSGSSFAKASAGQAGLCEASDVSIRRVA